MPAKIDLTNKIFGRLRVIKQAENISTPNGRSHVAWLCECECGNQIIARSDTLRNGHTVSCGCKKREVLSSAGKNKISKIEGKIFGRLTVLGDSGKRTSSGGVLWKCECSCGNITYVETSNLTRTKEPTISCGCAKSRGEEKLLKLFIDNQIAFIYQKKFDNCIFPETNRQLIFDFYLPDYHLLIEYDGEQHFRSIHNDLFDLKSIQKRDQYKNKWCKENNISLIRIPYTDFDKIDINYMRAIIERNGWEEIK